MLVPLSIPGAAPVAGDPDADADAAVARDFREHAAYVEGVALQRSRDPELAADAAQEAFARLLREARAGRYPDCPRAWLHRTVVNVTTSGHRRTAVARRAAPLLVRLDTPVAPDTVALQRELATELAIALLRLTEVERTALSLAAAGASGREIATRLDRSHGATRTLIHRARMRLRQEMEAETFA